MRAVSIHRPRDFKVPQSSKADPPAEVDEHRRSLLREAWLATTACTRWSASARRIDAPGEIYARALVFVPIVGLITGVILALADRALSPYVPPLARSACIVALATLFSGGLLPVGVSRTIAALFAGQRAPDTAGGGWPGAIAALLILTAEVLALGSIADGPARARALVLATLLSRWAIVPIGYGLRPLEESGLGIPFYGGLTFSEFGVSSVIGLGVAMGLYDVVGLAAIIAVALAILGLRLLLSGRLGGVGGYGLAAGAAVCELVTFALLAAINAI
jgi:adenosylcobinamide-GDP ribazoletransferase